MKTKWIHKPHPAQSERKLGLSLVSTTELGNWLCRSRIRVYELRVTQPFGGVYLSRAQYHSFEHILKWEALQNLGPDCISVSASGDNLTYRFVVTGSIYKEQLAKFVLAVLYDGSTTYLSIEDIPFVGNCSFPSCHDIGDLFEKISPSLGRVLTEIVE